MSSVSPERVRFDDLSAPDGEIYVFAEQPFTGTAFETDEEGRLISETGFDAGVRYGLSRTWNPETGQLLSELSLRDKTGSGLLREWHENPFYDPDDDAPELARERETEHGIVLRERRWDEDGTLLEDYVLRPDMPQYGTLERLRQLYGKAG